MESRYQTIIHPLNPLFDEKSKILILGSFPSVKTREQGFFYGHPQNRFWKILASILNEKIPAEIPEKRKMLIKNKIAIYDTIYQCDIIGSSDSSIKNVMPSDLSKIIKNSNIKQIFCNGGTSYKYFQKYHEKILNMKAIKLPSSSSANARYRIDDLVGQWSIIIKYLRS